MVGIDVGSTTVKATVVDPESRRILWSDYRRHNTRQPEEVADFLIRIGQAFPQVSRQNMRIFITGSGAGPLVEPLGAKFVQEVNAVTMAVEEQHPDAGSVVELGGQDAKVIIFKENENSGDKQSQTSMNDKCASGTGATIDKCMIKVGLPAADVARLDFDDARLHHVAAKCGVFAETDIVNLVKSGIPAPEIMCSLADAIVMQNLSVLTRGNTLRHKVILLGGPNHYLPFLQQCWRKRIPETWAERNYDWPQHEPLEDIIMVPDNALYYAAYGSVLYGLHEPAGTGAYRGLEPLQEFIRHGRKARLGEAAGPPLVSGPEEQQEFTRQYEVPAFKPSPLQAGQVVRAAIGVDSGSTSSKAVLIGEDGTILKKEYQLSRGNPIQDLKEMLPRLQAWVAGQDARLEIIGLGCTGYAADVLEKALKADVNIVETIAHMRSAVSFFDDVDVICDIGGQDIKVLIMKNGELQNFRFSNQCSAGNGMLLQAMADQFGVPVQEYAGHAFQAGLSPKFSYGCAVFLDSDRVNFQKEGYSKEELMAGLALVLPKNIWQYVVQIPRIAELGQNYVLQGGTQYNLAAVKAQADYIRERVPGARVHVHPHPGEAGAIGAAMEALRVVQRRGHSTFVGLDEAIGMDYSTRNDESTRCNFCPNNCSRTFIDTRTPDGSSARYISGFSCEKGTVEDAKALRQVNLRRNKIMRQYPNLVTYEARRLFKPFYKPPPLPGAGSDLTDIALRKNFLGMISKKTVTRPFRRAADQSRRQQVRIAMPKVLNLWTMAPFYRAWFAAIGVPTKQLIFSDDSGEEMFAEGGKYGSIDPCYPSKVAQAHIHNLLFHHHTREEPVDYIYFPTMTHVPTWLDEVQGTTSCPIVSGTPNVIKSAFTKEVDFFANHGVEYVDDAVNFSDPWLVKKAMFETWADRLGITEDESDFAVDQAYAAMDEFDRDLQEKGKAIIEQVELENRMCILLLCRPYHLDPGLNHEITEEFQALGYPVISMRSIPRDAAWLSRWYQKDIDRGIISSALDIRDVWPENYSVNSAQKVWAAKFAARHPNVAILDLSSFKCGHDAPTYGIIDSIVGKAGTPYSALHDIDANKPAGTMKIRVKTYGYTLGRRGEDLQDLARKKEELRLILLRKKRQLLERDHDRMVLAHGHADPRIVRELKQIREELGDSGLENIAATAQLTPPPKSRPNIVINHATKEVMARTAANDLQPTRGSL